jgi:hypothetical protein
MKIFNSIQELWDYCSFCPVCQGARQISVSVGPDMVFSLKHMHKEDETLHLECIYKKKQNLYTIQYKIDCNTNLFDVSVANVEVLVEKNQIPFAKVAKAYFYIYIRSKCHECGCSSTDSIDLEFGIVDKKVTNIQLDREVFRLLNEVDKFNITVIHDDNIMLVSRCYEFDEEDYDEDSKAIRLPLVKLDLLNQAKVVNKIKTLILFS